MCNCQLLKILYLKKIRSSLHKICHSYNWLQLRESLVVVCGMIDYTKKIKIMNKVYQSLVAVFSLTCMFSSCGAIKETPKEPSPSYPVIASVVTSVSRDVKYNVYAKNAVVKSYKVSNNDGKMVKYANVSKESTLISNNIKTGTKVIMSGEITPQIMLGNPVVTFEIQVNGKVKATQTFTKAGKAELSYVVD